jgi:hypothetical protein
MLRKFFDMVGRMATLCRVTFMSIWSASDLTGMVLALLNPVQWFRLWRDRRWFVIAAVVLYVVAALIVQKIAMMERAVRTTGTVVRVRWMNEEGVRSSYPFYQYNDSMGKIYEDKYLFPRRWEKGQRLVVLYDPRDPSRNVVLHNSWMWMFQNERYGVQFLILWLVIAWHWTHVKRLIDKLPWEPTP